MSKRDIEQALLHHGYRLIRQGKHNVWYNGLKTIMVPHSRTISPGLGKTILKRIG